MSRNLKKQKNKEWECIQNIQRKMKIENCFGISQEEFKEIKQWINNANPNEKNSHFPDFLFENGFIEHFAITSSLENKKGAKQKMESVILEQKSEKIFTEQFEKSRIGEITNYSVSKNFEEHSHNNIVKSIKKNWEKHIESSKKYIGNKEHSIFLMEYMDHHLHTAVEKDDGCHKIYHTYRITADLDLLKWLYKFNDEIEYLILYHGLIFKQSKLILLALFCVQ